MKIKGKKLKGTCLVDGKPMGFDVDTTNPFNTKSERIRDVRSELIRNGFEGNKAKKFKFD